MPRPLQTLLACSLLPLLTALAPAQTAMDTLRGRIAEHRLLGRLDTGLLHHYPPFVVFFETPRKPDPEREADLQERYGPWLESLAQTYHGTFVIPGRIPEPTTMFLVPLYIVDGQAAFRNARRHATETRPRYPQRTLALDDLTMVVTLADSGDDKRPTEMTRVPVMFEATRALVKAWCEGSYPGLEEQWLIDGLSGYYSSDGVQDVADYQNPPVNGSALKWLQGLDESERENLLVDLNTLVGLGGEEYRHEELLLRNRKAGGGNLSPVATNTIWYHLTTLWTHYLLRGEGGRWRTKAVKYVADVMRGDRGVQTLKQALEVDSLTELNEGFALHWNALLRGEGVEAGPAGTLPTAGGDPGVVTEALAIDPKDGSARLAVAMSRAARGALGPATAEIEEILGELDDQAMKFKLQAELERLAIAASARDKFLESLVGTRRKLSFKNEGETVKTKVLAMEDGVLTLEAKKEDDLASIPVEKISLADIALAMGRDVEDFGPEWLKGYYLALSGDPKWSRFIDTKSTSGKALARTLEKDMAGWISSGMALLSLDDLSRVPIPGDPESGERVIDSVKSLLDTYGDSDAVQAAKPALRGLAQEALLPLFAQNGVRDLVRGKITPLKDGRVRLEYNFKDPNQLEDLTPDDDYLADKREVRGELSADALKAGFAVRGGQLSGTGAKVFRLPIAFEAPIVRYRMVYGRATGSAFANMTVGICDDGKGSYIAAHDVFDLEVVDLAEGFVRAEYEEGARTVKDAKPYKLELKHDGKKEIALLVNGRLVRKAACGPRLAGEVFVWFHANSPIALQSLIVEGLPVLTGQEDKKAAWVEAQLTEMGL